MQLGRASVKRDPDLGTERHKLVDCPLLRGTHVGRRDDPDASAARPDAGQRFAEVPNARPDHERADQIDGIGGRELRAQLRADVGLPFGIDEQIALTEGRRRWRWQRHDVAERRPALDALKHARRERDLRVWLIAVRERAHDGVDTLGLRVCRVLAVEVDAELRHRVACQPVGRLGGVQRVLVNELCVEVRQRALERARDEVISRPGIRCAHRVLSSGLARGLRATHGLLCRAREQRDGVGQQATELRARGARVGDSQHPICRWTQLSHRR